MSKRLLFQKDLEHLINKHSLESLLGMPDFIMAEMLTDILGTIAYKTEKANVWSGAKPSPSVKLFEMPPNSERFITEDDI